MYICDKCKKTYKETQKNCPYCGKATDLSIKENILPDSEVTSVKSKKSKGAIDKRMAPEEPVVYKSIFDERTAPEDPIDNGHPIWLAIIRVFSGFTLSDTSLRKTPQNKRINALLSVLFIFIVDIILFIYSLITRSFFNYWTIIFGALALISIVAIIIFMNLIAKNITDEEIEAAKMKTKIKRIKFTPKI